MTDERGKIFVKPSFSFDWKIPNISSRFKENFFESTTFQFCGDNWCLSIQKMSSNIQTLILRRNSSATRHNVIYCVNILCNDGSEYGLIKSKGEFDEICRECEMYDFDKRVKLLQDESKISPDGTLTLSCSLRCDYHSQIKESVKEASKDETTEGKENDKPEKDDDVSSTKDEINPVVIESNKLLDDMEALFLSEKDSDAILIVRDRKFAVHRAVLGARSSVLEAMFRNEMVESTSGEVKIKEFDPDIFQDFLLYIYSAKVKRISEENVIGLYTAADMYNTQELKAKCVEFMTHNLSVSLFCSVVTLCLKYEESEILDVAMKFFMDNLKEIILTVQWQELLRENPTAANELWIKASAYYVPPKQSSDPSTDS